MNKPKLKTRTYVDWIEYSDYLRANHNKEFLKVGDKLWEWFCDTSDFSNGCFVSMEPAENMGWPEDHPATWLANRLFEDYPKGTDKYGGIDLWVRW